MKLRNEDDRPNIIKRSPPSRQALGPSAGIAPQLQNPNLLYGLLTHIIGGQVSKC